MKEGSIELVIDSRHPAFAGHFPGMPIVPGVVLLDEAIHAVTRELKLPSKALTIVAAKFLSPLEPGETLQLDFAEQANGDVRIELHTAGRRVASASLRPGRG